MESNKNTDGDIRILFFCKGIAVDLLPEEVLQDDRAVFGGTGKIGDRSLGAFFLRCQMDGTGLIFSLIV